MTDQTDFLDRIGAQLTRFMHVESSAGLVLLGATVAAMVVKNSPLGETYQAFLMLEGQVRVGSVDVTKPVVLWVNDLWMAAFFFVVGLEIKNEWRFGYFVDRRQIVLPAAGAVGGVLAPALIYLALNAANPETRHGWAIPTATDIAFALAVLSMLSTRVPPSLKLFLMTLAILDDLIAIVVIALVYTSGLSITSLVAAGICLVVMLGLRLIGVRAVPAYLIVGAVLWVCVLKSGVHATLAGVVTAFALPAYRAEGSEESNLDRLIDELHPWIAFGILPAFAFVNAGIAFEGINLARLLNPLPLGVFLGLVVGKALGVFGLAGLVIRLGAAQLPAGASWTQLFGVAVLCGVGFTMSLFIGGLAFAEIGRGYNRIDRLAVVLASVVSAIAGYLILRRAASADRAPPGTEGRATV